MTTLAEESIDDFLETYCSIIEDVEESEMLKKIFPTHEGVYRVPKEHLKAFISKALLEQREGIRREIGDLVEPYPIDIFSEPPKGWQNKLISHCERNGYVLDQLSAYYARWQRNLVKGDILSLPSLSNMDEGTY